VQNGIQVEERLIKGQNTGGENAEYRAVNRWRKGLVKSRKQVNERL